MDVNSLNRVSLNSDVRVQSFIMHSNHNFQFVNVYFTVSFGGVKPICIINSLCFCIFNVSFNSNKRLEFFYIKKRTDYVVFFGRTVV